MATTSPQPQDTGGLGLIQLLLKLGIPFAKLAQIPELSGALSGITGGLNLVNSLDTGNIPGAAKSAASIGGNIANLAGYPEVGQVFGSVGGPISLATGIANGDPLSTIMGAAQTGSLASGYLGGPTLSSLASQAYNLLPGATDAALAGAGSASELGLGAAGAADIGSFGLMANPATVMGGMMLSGGLAGKQADAEASQRGFRESAAALGSEMQRINQVRQLGDAAYQGPQLPGTLSLLRDTLQNAPNLGLFTHLGTVNMPIEQGDRFNAGIQRERAGAGEDWLQALDAANRQGVDLTGALASPWRAGTKGEPVQMSALNGINADPDVNLRQFAHLLDLTEPEAQQVRDALTAYNENGTLNWGNILAGAAQGYNPALTKAFGPDRLATLKERLGFDPDKQGGALDPEKINKLMDDQWLTSTVHDAIHDVGLAKGLTNEQLAQAGIAPGAWQTLAGGDVYGGGINAGSEQVGGGPLPSIADLAAFPGAGLGLAGLLAKARDILGSDYGKSSGLNAPVPGRNSDSGAWTDLNWTGQPTPEPPALLPVVPDTNIGGE